MNRRTGFILSCALLAFFFRILGKALQAFSGTYHQDRLAFKKTLRKS